MPATLGRVLDKHTTVWLVRSKFWFACALPLGDEAFETRKPSDFSRFDPPAGATIRFKLDRDDIWLSCNRAGWLHPAQFGLRTRFRPGYHFHRSYKWQDFSE